MLLPVLVMIFTAPLRAELIAYDGADYPPTSSISGKNGGTGWKGAWTGINNVVAGSLVFNGVATAGNRFVTDGGHNGSPRVIGTSGFESLLQSGRFGKEGTTLWFSFLFRAVSTSADNAAGVLFYDGAVSAANQVLFIGVPTGGAALGLFAAGGGALSSVAGTDPQTRFIVVKMMFGTPNGDRVFMYVNPPLDSEPTDNRYIAAVLNNQSFQFDRLLFSSGPVATVAAFDEFRLGETFADVAPLAPDRLEVTELASLPGPTPFGYSIAPLLQDSHGRLYGSTLTGGSGGSGQVFSVAENGAGFAPLHAFPAANASGEWPGGRAPGGLLLARDGKVYGGTQEGGTGGLFGNSGVLFRVNTDGSDFTILRHFDSQQDGAWMSAAPMQDADGVLYGVLRNGGTPTLGEGGSGTVFRMNADGSGFKVLHIFITPVLVPASTDGWDPRDTLTEGPGGMIYGTTAHGGTAGGGTLFRIGKDGSGYQIIRHFQSDGKGSKPDSSLLVGSDGWLYGTTESSAPGTQAVIYKLRPDGSDYQILAKLGGAQLGHGTLVEMPDGLLYGTAAAGGRPIPASGYLYRIGKDGSDYEVLHEFPGTAANGRSPVGGLLKGRNGALYGATVAGGTHAAGVLFRLSRRDATSQPEPLALFPSLVDEGSAFQLSFMGVPLATYEIQAAGTLQPPPSWQTVTTVQAGTDGQVVFKEIILPGTASRFFRVVNR